MTTPTPIRDFTPTIETNPDGMPYRATIPSKSSPTAAPYVLERSVAGRWMHIDSRCPGWTNNGQCYHVAALTALEVQMAEETGTALATVSPSVLAQIDALDEQSVIARLSGGLAEVSKKWIYSFPQGAGTVTGLSIDGVQEAARHLSTQGEAIEQVWVHLDDQNENEAYFTACAVRYAVSPDGRRVELDRAIRAKRQPKFTKKRDGSGMVFNDFWYEVGVAKALRNAVEALLPEAIKQHMIKFAGKTTGTPAPSTPRAAAERSAAVAPADGRKTQGAKNVKQSIVDLRKQAKEKGGDFATNVEHALHAAFPEIFDAEGVAHLSEATPEVASEIEAFLMKALAPSADGARQEAFA